MTGSGTMIRPAGKGEVELLAAFDRDATGGPDRTDLLAAAQREGRLLIADRHGEIVGFATRSLFFEYDFLELLVVRLPYRRMGIATALVNAVESASRSGKLFTSTNQSNVAMQQLCLRLGFQPSGVIENLDEGDPELFFVKRL